MGLGKTLQAITLLWTVMTQGVFFSVFTKCRKVFVWLPIIVSGSFVSGSPIIGLTAVGRFLPAGDNSSFVPSGFKAEKCADTGQKEHVPRARFMESMT